ncbi:hypothetical protein M9H77_08809 [Catharanthus roseus]|uniref:Uncharacterized protein n=1 Tax=Catharanthus roseus TaxID=4058 RepID=A0ACC0BZ19_CATRO|nr:hypothetical protein M9H77_08809 [Catharanthus roseus]
MTYGQLFAFIKQEALSACQELKFQAKYGSERHELGSFCEAFGIKGIQAPSAQLKRHSRPSQPRYSRRRSYSRRYKPSNDFYKNPKKHYSKKITCFKCGKPGHKANVCRSNKKINEILDQFPELDKELKEKLSISLVQDDSDVDSHPADFQDSSSTDDGNLSSPCACKVINMIRHSSNTTVKDQKELIFDIIQDLPPDAQKKQLEKLKALILREESSSARLVEPFSISKMFDRYPHMNPQIRQHSTKELQTEINSLKAQVKELKERVFSIETKNLELDTQIALLQSRNSKGKDIMTDSSIPAFTLAEIPIPVFNSFLKAQHIPPVLFKQLLLLFLHHLSKNPLFQNSQLKMLMKLNNSKNSSCENICSLAFRMIGKVFGLTGKPIWIGCSRHALPLLSSLVSYLKFNFKKISPILFSNMANLVRRMFSSGSSLDSKRIVQSEEEHIQCNFNDWTIPEEHIETIYKVGTFDFKTAFSVKTHEETMNIQEKFQTISLLSKASLSKYAEKGFRYIHYGLIQVAVKPLVHIGVDARIYLALRDKRLKRYKPSLLAMIQTNICNGPIYFNCAPNYSVSLTDPLIMNSLVLDIHMQGDEFEKLTEQFVVMYRVYYRLLSSQLNPRFKMIPTSRDETVLLHIEAEQSKTFTPKRLKWHEITIPDEFQIENPHPFPHIERNEISQIIEEPNGNVLIRFNSVREQEFGSTIPIDLVAIHLHIPEDVPLQNHQNNPSECPTQFMYTIQLQFQKYQRLLRYLPLRLK